MLLLEYVTIFRKTNRSARKPIIAYTRKYTFEHEDANDIKKKRVLLIDQASDWLQIWTTASSLDEKGNKAIKKNFFFSLTGWFSQIQSHKNEFGNDSRVSMCTDPPIIYETLLTPSSDNWLYGLWGCNSAKCQSKIPELRERERESQQEGSHIL